MVYLTQVVFYFLFFSPLGRVTSYYYWKLYPSYIHIFAIVTVLITLSGYLINDYFDRETDKINQKVKLSPPAILKLYFIAVFTGFILAFRLAMSLGYPLLTLIYLLAVVLLYMYSSSWKKKVLIGNIVVSGFTAGVPLILLYAELENLPLIKEEVPIILMFGLFSFLISMTREIIKDIEDVEGDRVASYNTLPIVYGVERAKLVAGIFCLTLIIVLLLWQYFCLDLAVSIHLLTLIVLYFPLIYLLIKLFRKSPPNWHSLSLLCKLIMLMGLLLLILLKCYPLITN